MNFPSLDAQKPFIGRKTVGENLINISKTMSDFEYFMIGDRKLFVWDQMFGFEERFLKRTEKLEYQKI